jgi:hypothetical protein
MPTVMLSNVPSIGQVNHNVEGHDKKKCHPPNTTPRAMLSKGHVKLNEKSHTKEYDFAPRCMDVGTVVPKRPL